MNIQTGIFTTKQAGIYQISFSTKYVASSAGQFGAWSDICINNKVEMKHLNDQSLAGIYVQSVNVDIQ